MAPEKYPRNGLLNKHIKINKNCTSFSKTTNVSCPIYRIIKFYKIKYKIITYIHTARFVMYKIEINILSLCNIS